MLGYRKVVALSVPSFGKVVAKADHEDVVLLSKYSDLGIPISIVVQRTMHQDERRSASVFPLGHRVVVHRNRLNAFWQRPNALHCHGRPHVLEPTLENLGLVVTLAHARSWINHYVVRFGSKPEKLNASICFPLCS